jgi:hypothetical protein
MNRLELGALEHENWIAYLSGVIGCTGAARVTRQGGAVTIRSDMPFDWFNQVLIERPDATPAGLLAVIEQGGQEDGSCVVRLREGVDDRFIAALEQGRLVAMGEDATVPGMVAFPINDELIEEAISQGRSSGLAIERVADPTGIDDHRHVVTEGFGSPPSVASGTTCADLLDHPDCAVYIGRAKGRPVVSGLGWRTGRTIGVYAIATVPTARRRGYGAAMTARVVKDGLEAGCDVAVLQASAIGRPVYERLGFRVAVRYVAYGRP